VVTIQTFPFVLDAIQERATLKDRTFAIIADEAHSSQSGSTARELRKVLSAQHQLFCLYHHTQSQNYGDVWKAKTPRDATI